MGIVMLFMMLMYILVSIGISKVVYRFTQKRFVSSLVFVALVTFPFWDLIAQKAIKTYYVNSGLLEPNIYEMPEKDENGMIESLSLVGFSILNLNKHQLESRYDYYKSGVKEFVEVSDSKYLNKIIRLNLQNKTFSIVPKSEARYTYQRYKNDVLFGLGEEIHTSIFDTKTHKILGEVIYIITNKNKNFFYTR